MSKQTESVIKPLAKLRYSRQQMQLHQVPPKTIADSNTQILIALEPYLELEEMRV